MKLIDKMAKEMGEIIAEGFESRLVPDALGPDGDFKPEYLKLLGMFMDNAYQAGFRAAREMAEQEARRVRPYYAVCCRVHGENAAENIAHLGESEVEE